MTMLDIGGGFCGGNFGPNGRVDLGGVPAAVNAALDEHFPVSSGAALHSPTLKHQILWCLAVFDGQCTAK